jgi:2-keto-4-pentenoate hydratase/2-oxohepta-3-ene-1,7-dioic acid hydratase in catechol pathway
MKLGRIARETIDGTIPRLVAVLPEKGEVVDLAVAERRRLQAQGAREDAARRVALATFPGSLSQALATGPEFLDRAQVAWSAADSEARLAMEDCRWLSAVDPTVMRDCMAFEQHMRNSTAKVGITIPDLFYELPAYYKGSPEGLIGHDSPVRWPSYTQWMDYELELGFVLGAQGSNLSPEEASKLIFGVTIYNDFSARDIQSTEMKLQLGPAKGKDFNTAVGPWVTTVDELDLGNMTMVARVNGEEWSRGNSGTIMWQPAEIVAYCSWGENLEPGDIIGSGTVGGGCGLELDRKLQPGDVVELEVSGVGVLRNQLGQPERQGAGPAPRKRAAATA